MTELRNLNFDTFDQAYPELLNLICASYEFRNSPRGNREIEILGISFSLEHPIKRGVSLSTRKFNLPFCFAEALWYMSGRNDLEFIEFYAPKMRSYSADKATLPGTGYGKRIFSLGDQSVNQWSNVVNLLKSDDPDSKRAVIQLFDGKETLTRENIDVCCTLALQFLVRNGKLDCVAFMRANDFFRGLVSDVFSFTFLQECMAAELGLEVGRYFHMVGSAHIYEGEIGWARKVIQQAKTSADRRVGFPNMPSGCTRRFILAVMELESRLRSDDRAVWEEPSFRNLPRYWQDVLIVLGHRVCEKAGEKLPATQLRRLNPYLRKLLIAHGQGEPGSFT